VYRKFFGRKRLTLPLRSAEEFGPAAGTIELPALYPLSMGEDTPLNDMLLLLNLAKGRKARRILEIGTYRARTTYALHLNCPTATIVSYDIQVLDSEFRRRLTGKPNVQLRTAPFTSAAETLRREARFDFIFVDASHQFEHALEDSRLALELVDPDGVIVWHDYRINDYAFDDGFCVPEVLDIIRQSIPVYAVPDTFCAVHLHSPSCPT
jgi:predicted O-methyltransferase YrrM